MQWSYVMSEQNIISMYLKKKKSDGGSFPVSL